MFIIWSPWNSEIIAQQIEVALVKVTHEHRSDHNNRPYNGHWQPKILGMIFELVRFISHKDGPYTDLSLTYKMYIFLKFNKYNIAYLGPAENVRGAFLISNLGVVLVKHESRKAGSTGH